MLQRWTSEVEALLLENVTGLFVKVQELEILCELREEVISLLVDSDEETSVFERKVCEILVKEVATQMIRLVTARIKKIHVLESRVRKLIAGFNRTLSF